MKKLYISIVLLGMLYFTQKAYSQCAQISYSPHIDICAGTKVTFTGTSELGTDATYEWNFGDATPIVNGSTVEHIYDYNNQTTTYTVTLTVSDSSQSCTETKPITIRSRPQIRVSGDTLFHAPNLTLADSFITTLTIDPAYAALGPFTWDFGDGFTITSQALSQTHAYSFGTHLLTITAAGASCPSYVQPIRYYTMPKSPIVIPPTENTFCEGDSIWIKNRSNPIPGNVDFFLLFWDYDNDRDKVDTLYNTDDQFNQYFFTYQEACQADILGYAREIRLYASNFCWQRHSYNASPVTIIVRPHPEFDIPTDLCWPEDSLQGLSVDFENKSCPNFSIDPLIYEWEFGDGGLSTGISPTHHYDAPGTYDVSLTATTNGCGSDKITKTMTIYDQPKPKVSPDITYSCGDTIITFTNESTPMDARMIWHIEPLVGFQYMPGSDSTSRSPQIRFFVADTFDVRMTIENECGEATWEEEIVISKAPDIYLYPLADTCGNEVTYQPKADVLPNGSEIISYHWTFEGGTLTSYDGLFPPPITFNQEVNTITLTATNDCGSTETSQTFRLLPGIPIQVSDVDMCVGDTICLGAEPLGGIWMKEGIPDSTCLFSSTTKGKFKAIYRIDSLGCTFEDSIMIFVKEKPQISLEREEMIGCKGDQLSLPAASPSNGVWIGDSVINNLYFYSDTSGTFEVIYEVLDTIGCSSTTSLFITIPSVDAGNDTVFCLSEEPQILPIATPEGGEWKGAQIENNMFLPNAIGRHLIYYDVEGTNGCLERDSLWVEVINPDSIDPGKDTILCENHGPYSLTEGGYWYGEGIRDHAEAIFYPSLAGGGVHVLTYRIGAGSCQVEDQIIIEVLSSPNMEADTIFQVCESSDDIILSGGKPEGGWWTGNRVDSLENGIFIFLLDNVGTYPIVYHYKDANGCEDSVQTQVIIHPLPQLNVEIDSIACLNTEIVIENQTTGAVRYYWDFGDGGFSTQKNPTHKYTLTGRYILTYKAFTAEGCEDSASWEITVYDVPQPYFQKDAASGCAILEVNFTNESTLEGGNILWDFGGGYDRNGNTTSTSFQPETIYFDQGTENKTYIIELYIENQCATVSYRDSVLVFPKPIPQFITDKNTVCSSDSVSFGNTSVGNPQTFIWKLNGDIFSTDSIPQPIYPIYDSLGFRIDTITLIAENNCGIDSVSHVIKVLPKNIRAIFNTDTTWGCPGLKVNFTDGSRATFISWKVDDLDFPNTPNLTYIFYEPGKHKVFQYVSDGCSFDTTEITIDIYPTPDVTFSADTTIICLGDTITFFNHSIGTSSYLWDFRDGDTSSLLNPQHVYRRAGTYWVTLKGYADTLQCPGVDSLLIHVLEGPELNFEVDALKGCSPLPINIHNNTEAGFFLWEITGPDNLSFNIPSPSFTLNKPGEYQIRFTAQNAQNCRTDSIFYVVVDPVPISLFEMASYDSCGSPQTVCFLNQSIGSNLSYYWFLGDGDSSKLVNPCHPYTEVGEYEATLISKTIFGCTDTVKRSFTIYPKPHAIFSVEPLEGCMPLSVQLNNLSENFTTTLWDFGDGTPISNIVNPTHIYKQAGTYDIRLIVDYQQNCFDTLLLSDYVKVLPSPEVDFTYKDLLGTKAEGIVAFQNISINGDRYYWDFGDGTDIVNLENPVHQYLTNGPHIVMLVGENSNSCRDTIQKVVQPAYFGGLYIPNAFAPFAGNNNDLFTIFKPIGIGLKEFEIAVYTTWGTLVWSSSMLENGVPSEVWDGRINGAISDLNVFIWKVQKATFDSGEEWKGPREGTLTLIR